MKEILTDAAAIGNAAARAISYFVIDKTWRPGEIELVK